LYKNREKEHTQMILPHEFFLPFGGHLNSENRWVKLALIIPWFEIERRYRKNFRNLHTGQVARSSRMALGTLIIQNRCSDNGKSIPSIFYWPRCFSARTTFSSCAQNGRNLMTHFRKRLNKQILNEINELIALEASKPKKDDDSNNSSGSDLMDEEATPEEIKIDIPHQGKLILDATCTPADVHYPTDLWLLNESREKLETVIDTLHAPLIGKQKNQEITEMKLEEVILTLQERKSLVSEK